MKLRKWTEGHVTLASETLSCQLHCRGARPLDKCALVIGSASLLLLCNFVHARMDKWKEIRHWLIRQFKLRRVLIVTSCLKCIAEFRGSAVVGRLRRIGPRRILQRILKHRFQARILLLPFLWAELSLARSQDTPLSLRCPSLKTLLFPAGNLLLAFPREHERTKLLDHTPAKELWTSCCTGNWAF